jgi:cysteine desulfurase family protein (TIGR01976 family)
VTEIDHDANVAPWLLVGADHDLVVRTAPMRSQDGTLDLEGLRERIGTRTRVLACTLASNALGSLTDITRVAALAREAGALLWLDAVHFVPHRRLDAHALGADVVLSSAYKYFGPHLGVAAVRRELAQDLPADRVRPSAQTPPGHRFETGTLSHEALAGFTAAVQYLAGLGSPGLGSPGLGDAEPQAGVPARSRKQLLQLAYARIEAHETGLTRHTLSRLAQIPGLTVHGIADPARAAERTPTFCVTLERSDPRSLSEELARRGLFTYHGDYYAVGVMRRLGLAEKGGAVRAGYLHYTTREEADRLCDALAELA